MSGALVSILPIAMKVAVIVGLGIIVGSLIERHRSGESVWRRAVLKNPVGTELGDLRDVVASLSQTVTRVEERVADLVLQRDELDEIKKSPLSREETRPPAGPESPTRRGTHDEARNRPQRPPDRLTSAGASRTFTAAVGLDGNRMDRTPPSSPRRSHPIDRIQ